MRTNFCICGGQIGANFFCNLCGHKYVYTTPEPTPGAPYCDECGTPLVNYLCPQCDADLVRDMTTEYHPYLWEMEIAEQTRAHAMGVCL